MGLLRLLLALAVLAGHANSTLFGFEVLDAWYAVNFFFVISGFYMALVLNGTYASRPLSTFYKSRLLRLLPLYYIGLVLGFWASSDAIQEVFENLEGWAQIVFILQNLFIFGQDYTIALVCMPDTSGTCLPSLKTLVNPPSWSLAVELTFYACAPFILKSPKKTLLFFMTGIAYFLLIKTLDFPAMYSAFARAGELADYNYYSFGASMMYFGAGALAYHVQRGTIQANYPVGIVIVLALAAIDSHLPAWQLALVIFALPVLFQLTAQNKLDRIIGELSYPVYILHWPILQWLEHNLDKDSVWLEGLSMGSLLALITISLSLVINFSLERAINRYRYQKVIGQGIEKEKQNAHHHSLNWALAGFIAMAVCTPFLIIGHEQIANTQAQTLAQLSPINHTDKNWFRGISRNFPGMIVSQQGVEQGVLRPGNLVRFEDGSLRKIMIARSNPKANNKTVFLRLEGERFENANIGFPAKFEVIQPYSLFD